MLVNLRTLNRRNLVTNQCAKGEERKCRRLAEEELRESSERAFQAYGDRMETFTLLKYLERVMTEMGYDWSAVARNLRKAWKSWTQMMRILGR